MWEPLRTQREKKNRCLAFSIKKYFLIIISLPSSLLLPDILSSGPLIWPSSEALLESTPKRRPDLGLSANGGGHGRPRGGRPWGRWAARSWPRPGRPSIDLAAHLPPWGAGRPCHLHGQPVPSLAPGHHSISMDVNRWLFNKHFIFI